MRLAQTLLALCAPATLTSQQCELRMVGGGPARSLRLLMRLPRHGVASGSGKGGTHDAILICGSGLGRCCRCCEPGYFNRPREAVTSTIGVCWSFLCDE
jgi:hypothetical protein